MTLKITTPQLEKENNSQFAYRVLRDNIMRLTLEPGFIINEAALTEELGISRTPVREALFRLKDEHLIEVVPHKNSSVSLIDFALVHEGFFLRSTLEPVAIKNACRDLSLEALQELEENLALQEAVLQGEQNLHTFFELDELFHAIVYRHVNMENIWQSTKIVSTHYDRLRYFDVLMGTVRLTPLYNEHLELFEMLKQKEAEAVSAFTYRHLSGYRKLQPFLIKEYRQYFKDLDI